MMARWALLLLVLLSFGLLSYGLCGRLRMMFQEENPAMETSLLNAQWRQEPSWQVFVAGAILLVAASLVLLWGVLRGWEVRPAVPDALKPFAEHLVWESPPWWVISRAFGAFLFLVGVASLLSSPLGTNAMERNFFGPHVLAMAFLGAPVGWILIGFAAQLWTRNVAAVLRRKDRHPILYLRSFKADARWLDNPTDLIWMFLLPGRFETLERSLYKSLAGAGPLIAIGQPGEMLPPMGATRLYVKHEKWQEVVAHMARVSGLVLLRVGTTDSFWWEVEHVIESCPPAKVLFLLPPRDRLRAYDALARHLAPRLKQLFPQPSVNMEFVGFREDWSPVLLGNNQVSVWSKLRYLVIGSAAPVLRDALLPALRNAGYSVGRLPFMLREWVLILFVVLGPFLFVGLVALLVYLDK
ncbi:MAG: hypothetical protein ACKVP0_19540 [Pirellulaceae bacterium]